MVMTGRTREVESAEFLPMVGVLVVRGLPAQVNKAEVKDHPLSNKEDRVSHKEDLLDRDHQGDRDRLPAADLERECGMLM